MTQSKVDKTVSPNLLDEISLDKLIERVMEKKPSHTVISYEDYQFAKNVIENSQLKGLRADNFCIDLTQSELVHWTKAQYKAFAKLFAKFSDHAAILLKQKQEQKLDVTKDIQVLWVKLPEQSDENRKIVNGINKILLNNGYKDNTGNEEGITLFKFINYQKPNPITRFPRVTQSVSVVIVVQTEGGDKVLLLKRGGLGERVGNWGTLTGIKERDEQKEKTLIREVHEEINVLLHDKQAHYVGSVHTPNLSKDLVDQGRGVSYADDCSYVYGIRISEDELTHTIKLDEENSSWRLFSREELLTQFKVHNPRIHGEHPDSEELPVAVAKSLLVLDCAKNNFKTMEYRTFNFPYTNSPGFFAHPNIGTKKELQDRFSNTMNSV